MTAQPSGTITFLFTDIEGSSRLWEEHPEEMKGALARHDLILRQAFGDGFIFKTVGDAFCAAFHTASAAASAAVAAQRALHAEAWDRVGGLRVRMALHTGAAEQRDGDYFGQTLNRVSRILAAAHGGQMLLSLPTEELVRDSLPAGVRLRNLGERRLRDLSRPETIFELIAGDLPSDFPPLRSLESVPNNLPLELTSFIGREREMAEVRRLLGGAHLLTLVGAGGTGKTRLSLQLGAELLEKFQDGVWLVEFATIDDAALVPETVAAVLNVRQEAGRPLASTLANFLRAKTLLLLFDNCEHVVAACAHLAEALLRVCRNLVILASSREPLGIGGEVAWPLPPLNLPAHWREIASGPGAAERILKFEAVRLFVDRTVAARPSFRLTDANAAAVAQICWRLDGIPLAIELAAARARVLRVDQIAERLDDRFHLLTAGSRTAVPRQQTLRALIDWSYDLLNEPEKKLLRRLSVFGRGRSLEAIEAVCSSDGLEQGGILDLLTQLVDKSLLTVEKSEATGGVRYFMLESVWDYSREKLAEAGETAAFRERHLDFFLGYAEQIEEKITGPQQQTWLERVEEDGINMRFAVEASIELPGRVQKGLRLVAALQRYVEVRGLFKETRDDFAQLLAHPDAAPRNAARANALAAAGRLAWMADDDEAARRLHAEALEIYRELGDARREAFILADMALAAADRRELEAADAMLARAAELALPFEEARLRAHIVRARGFQASARRDFAESFALYAETLELYRQVGDAWLVRIGLWAAGVTAAILGRYEEARAYFEECLTNFRSLRSPWGMPFLLEAFAALAVAEGQYTRAARLLGASEALRAKNGISTEPSDHPAMREILSTAADHFTQEEARIARREGRGMSIEEAITFSLSRS